MIETFATQPRSIAPPRLWDDAERHFLSAIDSPWYRLITHLNALLVEETADFYRERGIAPVLMPVTVGSVSSPMGLGSDSLPVEVDLFDERTYLADSMQFQLEFMLRHGLSGAYYVMPTFRGETPDSSHLNQFFHSEAEIVGGLADVMGLVEAYVLRLARAVLASKVGDAVRGAAGTLRHLEELAARESFPQITFEQARKLLGDEYFTEVVEGVPAITRAGEQQLIKHYGGVVWLTRPHHLAVPFYQAGDADGTARCADLLLGVGEVAGCGERHSTGEQVLAALAEHGVAPAEYEWYVRMRESHPLRTAGFGLGTERLLLWVLQHGDIRDLHVMPRLRGQYSWL
ncbi:asparagine synthetase A [Streptomyces sp. NPDC060031]|uniref:asparagine synthetase A n=1 Tax=Streptomyces sp. NPDC060031 TaxID=3347043 RepID=UPI003689AB7F